MSRSMGGITKAVVGALFMITAKLPMHGAMHGRTRARGDGRGQERRVLPLQEGRVLPLLSLLHWSRLATTPLWAPRLSPFPSSATASGACGAWGGGVGAGDGALAQWLYLTLPDAAAPALASLGGVAPPSAAAYGAFGPPLPVSAAPVTAGAAAAFLAAATGGAA